MVAIEKGPEDSIKEEETIKEYQFEEKYIVSELIKDVSPAVREALRMQIRMIARKMTEPKLSVEAIKQLDVSEFYEIQTQANKKYNIKTDLDFLEAK